MSEEKPKTEEKAPKKEAAPKAAPKGGKLAVVLLRSMIGLDRNILRTLELMRIKNRHVCAVIDNTPAMRGMAQKLKDCCAWGEVSDATIKELEQKRGEKDPKDPKKLKGFFRLAPPQGGFERGGIKRQFNQGGALGYRGDKMNDLLKKMM